MKHPLLVPILAALLLTACKQTTTTSAPGLTDQNATVIAMDEAGQLIDFVPITPDSDIIRIEFLDKVIPALRSKDFDTLSKHVHRTADAPDTVTPFLKSILSADMTSYCFVQVDPNHPDNQDLVEANQSLPIQWLLEIDIGDASGASLEIGQHNGRLMFTN